MELAGKVAIVTGSGGEGSGRAEARRLAEEGCPVVVSDINESGGRETQRLIASAGGRAEFFRCDVSVQEDVARLVAFAEEKYGGLDILVCGLLPGPAARSWGNPAACSAVRARAAPSQGSPYG